MNQDDFVRKGPAKELLGDVFNWSQRVTNRDDWIIIPSPNQDQITGDTRYTVADAFLPDDSDHPALIEIVNNRPTTVYIYEGDRRWSVTESSDGWRMSILFDNDIDLSVQDPNRFPLRIVSRLSSNLTGEPFRIRLECGGSPSPWK